MDNRPIGVFDSGVGGLSVIIEIKKQLPKENFIYFADSKHAPYGIKTKSEICNLTYNVTKFLKEKNSKAIIIACNTATIASLNFLQERFNIPIIGIIESAVNESVEATKNGKIGILATEFSIKSGVFNELILNKNKNLEVFGVAAPILHIIVEYGIFNNELTNEACRYYLKEILEKKVDTLLLGCTHFPFLENDFIKNIPSKVNIINPARRLIIQLSEFLKDKNMLGDNTSPNYKFFTSFNDTDKLNRILNDILKTNDKFINII